MQNQWSFRTKSRLKAIDNSVKVSQVIGKKNSSWNPFYPSFTDETVVLVTEDKRTYETTKASADGNWNLTFSLRWLADDGSTTEVAKFKRAWMPWTLMFVTLWSDTLEWKQDNLIAWANIQIAADWKTISATDTIPNNATITIQKNWTDIESFTADESTNKTINITVPVTAADVAALPDSTKYWATVDMSINSSTYVVTLTLKDQDWNALWTAQTIDLPLESVVVSGSYDDVNKKIVLTLQDGSTIEFSVADLVSWLQTEITSSNKLSADLVDDSSTTHKFVTASDKTTWSWKQDALVSWTNIKTINNQDLLWSGNITISWWWWASITEVTVSTAYWTAAKVGTTTAGNYTPSVWDLLLVNFVYWNTANSVTLDIDNSWAKNIKIWWANATRNTLNLVSSNTATNSYVLMTYDGTNYVTHATTNTTYSASSFDIKDLTDSTNLKTEWSDKVDWPESATDWHLAVFDWATWKLIKDWWAVPIWVPAVWTNWQVLTVVGWAAAWANAAWSDYSWVTKTISWWTVELWLRTIVDTPTWNFTLTAPATLKDWEEYAIRIISETSYTMTLWTWFTNPRNVNTTLSGNATDQYVFLAIWGELELQPLVDTWA